MGTVLQWDKEWVQCCSGTKYGYSVAVGQKMGTVLQWDKEWVQCCRRTKTQRT